MKNLITMLCLSGLLAICSLSYAGQTAIGSDGGRGAWVIINGKVWMCWNHDAAADDGRKATCFEAKMKVIGQE